MSKKFEQSWKNFLKTLSILSIMLILRKKNWLGVTLKTFQENKNDCGNVVVPPPDVPHMIGKAIIIGMRQKASVQHITSHLGFNTWIRISNTTKTKCPPNWHADTSVSNDLWDRARAFERQRTMAAMRIARVWQKCRQLNFFNEHLKNHPITVNYPYMSNWIFADVNNTGVKCDGPPERDAQRARAGREIERESCARSERDPRERERERERESKESQELELLSRAFLNRERREIESAER